MIIRTGISTDAKPVYSGCFTLVDTHGLPLTFLLQELVNRNALIDWEDYILSAWKKGWTISKTLSHILDAVQDVYSKQDFDAFHEIFIPTYKKLAVLYFSNNKI